MRERRGREPEVGNESESRRKFVTQRREGETEVARGTQNQRKGRWPVGNQNPKKKITRASSGQ